MQLGARQDDVMAPPQAPARSPAGIGLDVVAQRVAGVAGLADGIDALGLAVALDQPALVGVVPDVGALDFNGDDAGVGHQGDQVDLMVLVAVGQPEVRQQRAAVELADRTQPDLVFGHGHERRGDGN